MTIYIARSSMSTPLRRIASISNNINNLQDLLSKFSKQMSRITSLSIFRHPKCKPLKNYLNVT